MARRFVTSVFSSLILNALGEKTARQTDGEKYKRELILEIPKGFKNQSKEGHYDFAERLNIKYTSTDGDNTWRTALPPGSEHSGKAPLYLRDEKTSRIHNHGHKLMYEVFTVSHICVSSCQPKMYNE